LFRTVSISEGLSLLLLLAIAMPIKYIFNEPMLVKIIGMIHGILFIVYVLFALFLKKRQRWSFLELTIILTASIIPFGTFYVDRKFLKNKTA
jgi:integral membrane protein